MAVMSCSPWPAVSGCLFSLLSPVLDLSWLRESDRLDGFPFRPQDPPECRPRHRPFTMNAELPWSPSVVLASLDRLDSNQRRSIFSTSPSSSASTTAIQSPSPCVSSVLESRPGTPHDNLNFSKGLTANSVTQVNSAYNLFLFLFSAETCEFHN
jgi:hypothetical protein